jgi:hypothetical protein
MKRLAELGYEMDIINFNLLFKLQIAESTNLTFRIVNLDITGFLSL